jgi:hypothetical protein
VATQNAWDNMGAGVSTQARVVNVVTPQKENDDASSTSGDYSTVRTTDASPSSSKHPRLRSLAGS